ncbi:MAG: phosphoribosylamine--glycine ligase [Clostridia bacterium]|nr:phosphoribosylamine--glycine ligase [Clostridia bacterium]
MEVLIIGSRGREHAYAVELSKDSRVDKIHCIPGNGGIQEIATCPSNININNYDEIEKYIDDNSDIKLVIVSPDELLQKGFADKLKEKGLKVIGCSAKCAELETNKEYANSIIHKYNIPSPEYRVFSDYAQAKNYIKNKQFPLVVKSNGRSAGKAIMYCSKYTQAENALYDMMVIRTFGDAGRKVCIEEYIQGENVIIPGFSDGDDIILLPAVENYKRVFDGELGLNTAGMGATVPCSKYTKEVEEKTYSKIAKPLIDAMKQEGFPYVGMIGLNVIITPSGDAVLVDVVSRFPDVESQVIIPQLRTPLLDIFDAMIDKKVGQMKLDYANECGVCVVLTSGGYPLEYVKNIRISIGKIDDTVNIYHVGTKLVEGELRTSGGRVLAVSSIGKSKEECVNNVYKNIRNINFDGMHFRHDIKGK